MPPAPNRTWSSNGGGHGHGNLFLEADPEAVPTRARSRRSPSVHPAASVRGRGLVVPIQESAPRAAVVPKRPDAAAFTRTSARLGGLRDWARERAQRADANARPLIAGLAARPYGALLALAVAGAMLLALSWTGLALRSATEARHSANHRAILAAAAAKRDQGQLAALSGQLEQARAAQLAQATPAAEGRQPATVTPAAKHPVRQAPHADRRR